MFFKDFSKSMVKMGNNGVLLSGIGGDQEIAALLTGHAVGMHVNLLVNCNCMTLYVECLSIIIVSCYQILYQNYWFFSLPHHRERESDCFLLPRHTYKHTYTERVRERDKYVRAHLVCMCARGGRENFFQRSFSNG